MRSGGGNSQRRPEGRNLPGGNKGKDNLNPNGDKPDTSNGANGKSDKLNEEQQPEETDNSGGPGIASPKWVYYRFVGLFRSIKPVRGSYLIDKKFNLQGLMARPSWRYMFGLTDKANVPFKIASGLASPDQSIYSDSYTLDSGFQPGHGLDISTGYSFRKTNTHSSTDPIMTKSTTFPNLTVNLSGLEKIFLFQKFSTSVGLQSGYSRKVDLNGRADTGELYKRDTAKQYSPLAAVSINFKNNIRATIRYDMARTISQNLRKEGQTNRDVNTSDNTFKVSFSYSLTAPQGLKLPLLKRVKFNSQLSLNLDVTVKNATTQSVSNGLKSIDANTSEFIVEPRLSYQFSKAITGGVQARWDDANDKIQKRKHHIRELGITAEIKF